MPADGQGDAGRCWEGGVREMRNQGDSRDSSQAEGEGSARWGFSDACAGLLRWLLIGFGLIRLASRSRACSSWLDKNSS